MTSKFASWTFHRRWMAITVALTSMALLSSGVSSAQDTGSSSSCPDPGPNREAEDFREPPPSRELSRAVSEFQAGDPEATFTFFNCHVDSFATRPRPRVPGYALPALRREGISSEARTPELLAPLTREAKAGQDLDANSNRQVPLPPETFGGGEPASDAAQDDPRGVDPGTARPREENRADPALVLEPRDSSYRLPSAEVVAKGARAAKPVLLGFLGEHAEVFEVGTRELVRDLPSLEQIDYTEGRFFRKAAFAQTLGGVPVLDGKTLVLYDVNWNVIGISRTIFTPRKLDVAKGGGVPERRAETIARRAIVDATGEDGGRLAVAEAVRGVDVIRRISVWDVRMVDPPRADFTVRIDARSGRVLNIDDNVLGYDDAKVRRWAYTDGRLDFPFQVNSTVPTADDNTLVHDMFNIVNDERGGATTDTCNQTPEATSWRSGAYGTTEGKNFLRPTIRTNRDFTIWSPASQTGSFAESHTYFWAREYMRWNKQALHELGVLDADPDERPALNIVVNGCVNDFYASTYDLTTAGDIAEKGAKITLREDCRVTNPSCPADSTEGSSSFITCEDGGCSASASVVQHELNHFILGSYFGVSSSLDCGSSKQGRFLHEGTFGSVVPHMFWHFWYGVGYKPQFEGQLFTSSRVRGRIHSDTDSRLNVFDYSCPDYDNPDKDGKLGQQPYDAGRVAGQPLWELYHGTKVDGNTMSPMARYLSDTDALISYYWAVDLVQGSTYKDRVELAVRVMELLDKYTIGVTPQIQQDWCAVWEHHGLRQRMPAGYCG